MGVKKIIKYTKSADDLEREQGKRNYFVFDIRTEIEYLDKHSKGKFNAEVYSPLVFGERPTYRRGTIAYDDFWDEQDRRCIEGYAPLVNGVQYPRITGPHYFYLNTYWIMKLIPGDKKKKLDYPDYRALDHMIFLELEKAERDGYGIIVGKARRMGLSYIGSIMVLWNLIFFKDNTCAVGAGKDDKAQALFLKLKKSMENIIPEFRVSYRARQDQLKLAYKKTEDGVKKDAGIQSELDVRTFYSDPSAFEGGSYSFFIFEEIGIHENLIKSYKASEPCFTEGATQFGVPFLFGTGGEVDKGSRDFNIMFKSPESYNLKKLFIPKYMYYPGNPDADTKKEGSVDALDSGVNFFDLRTGLNDEEAALKHILIRREMAKKSKDGYVKECQSYPIKESDIFLKTSGGKLDRLALSAQREALYNGDGQHEVEWGRYEWKDTDEIRMQLSRCQSEKEKNLVRIKAGIGVEFVEDVNGLVQKLKGFYPINTEGLPYMPDIIGVDSYDESETSESDSLGCSLVYRCFHKLSAAFNLPVAMIHERGDGTNDDTFWDNCLKQSVYWRAESLIEYTKIAVLNYFKDVYAHKYLRVKPNIDRAIVTDRGRQEHGVRMTGGEKGFKSLLLSVLRIEVKENVSNICFENLIDELIDYGDRNTDTAMAFGIALIHKLDIFDYITEDIQDEVVSSDPLNFAYYTEDSEGNLVINMYEGSQDPFDKMETFDHRQYMSKEERENYINFVQESDKQKNAEKARREKAFELSQLEQGNPFSSLVQEFRDKNAIE